MLTPDQVEALRLQAGMISDPINRFLLEDIGRRIAEAGQLTSTAAYQVWRAQQLGMSQRKIKKELRGILNVSHRELRHLLTQSAQVGYRFDLKNLPDVQAVPFEKNVVVQQLIAATVSLAEADLTNLTQTLGMVDPYGKVLPLGEAYRSSMDYAFSQVFTGASDYNTAIRLACTNLAREGVRVIHYESGIHTSLEAAVRRNIMGGTGLLVEQISRQNHDVLGADGWEISAHAASAPDHEPIQGRQYTDEEYEALNGRLTRRIGTLNCGHMAFPIILGISEPQYPEEERRRLQEENAKGVVVDGRHYTGYEATQKQRQIERAIRSQKRRVLVEEATGVNSLQQNQIKLHRLNEVYHNFSKAAGLRTERERLMVVGFGKGQAARTVARGKEYIDKYSAVRYNKDGTIVVTDDWKSLAKVTIPRKYMENAVIESQTTYKNGLVQIDRTLYDERGIMKTQIHSGGHNRPDQHPLGCHAHDYFWDENGQRTGRIDRDLTDPERRANADILKNGGKSNE